jgi:hypothetical protein
VCLNLYLLDQSGTKFGAIQYKFHVVSDFSCPILIGKNIINSENIVIYIASSQLTISSCSYLKCSLQITAPGIQFVENAVCTPSMIAIKSKCSAFVPIKYKMLPLGQKYPFKPYSRIAHLPETTYILCNNNFTRKENDIVVRNTGIFL